LAASDLAALPKPIDVAVDYLRPGRPSDVYARAAITRQGSRVANVRVEAWQTKRSAPIATLHGHFLVKPVGA
jgi:acyl-coenzyme A thioesterase PaaI-like protein